MVLPDTSIWIDHLRKPNQRLADFLLQDGVLAHPFVIGELALGGHNKSSALLQQFAEPFLATPRDVLRLIKGHGLVGRGIGYVDVHLLASVLITPEVKLWTLDQKLHKVAKELGVAA